MDAVGQVDITNYYIRPSEVDEKKNTRAAAAQTSPHELRFLRSVTACIDIPASAWPSRTNSALEKAKRDDLLRLSAQQRHARLEFVQHEIAIIKKQNTVLKATHHLEPENFFKPNFWGACIFARNNCGLSLWDRSKMALKGTLEAVPSTACRALVRAAVEVALQPYTDIAIAKTVAKCILKNAPSTGFSNLDFGLDFCLKNIDQATLLFNELDRSAIVGVVMGVLGAAPGDFMGACIRAARAEGGIHRMNELDLEKVLPKPNPILQIAPSNGSNEPIRYVDTRVDKTQKHKLIFNERLRAYEDLLKDLKNKQNLSREKGHSWAAFIHPVVTFSLNFSRPYVWENQAKAWRAGLGGFMASGLARVISGMVMRLQLRHAGYQIPESGNVMTPKKVIIPLWVPVLDQSHQRLMVLRTSRLQSASENLTRYKKMARLLQDLSFNIKTHASVFWGGGYKVSKFPLKVAKCFIGDTLFRHLICGYALPGVVSNAAASALAQTWSQVASFKSISEPIESGIKSAAGDLFWDTIKGVMAALRMNPIDSAQHCLERSLDFQALETEELLCQLDDQLRSGPVSAAKRAAMMEQAEQSIFKLERLCNKLGQQVEDRILPDLYHYFCRENFSVV